MKKALITTTINVPYLLTDYVNDFIKYGHKDVEIIVAGDIKTPPEAKDFCEALCITSGVKIHYLGIPEQHDFLDKFPTYKSFLPWNCVQRRNIAILMAYHAGAEIIYTIDDDNFLHTENYIGAHKLGYQELVIISMNSGWFNVCSHLINKDNAFYYPRGYAFTKRNLKEENGVCGVLPGRVVANAGLWVGDPDVDAVTRLAIAPESTDYHSTMPLSPGKNTKCPFNSQNTALHRDVIPAYCLATGVGRYDDILASYIVKRIADHLGDYISFGLPLVNQKRNPHDLFKDLKDELIGMQLVDRFVDWLYEIQFKGQTYKDCTKEIIPVVKARANGGDLTFEQRNFLNSLCLNYETWMECV